MLSEDRAKELGLKPKARIVASAVTGIEPEIMGVGPITAVQEVLKRAKMTIDDIDIVELNEAFAAQVLPVCEAVGMDPFSERFNPHGGAIALGHPFGMTGARIMTTLLNGLETADKTIGLETMCVGGGQGMAMIVERLNPGEGTQEAGAGATRDRAPGQVGPGSGGRYEPGASPAERNQEGWGLSVGPRRPPRAPATNAGPAV